VGPSGKSLAKTIQRFLTFVYDGIEIPWNIRGDNFFFFKG